jgi:hypothetical protein
MKIPMIISSVRGTAFMFGYPRHNTGNLEVDVVSFLSHREGGAMVHPQRGKCER